MQSRLCGQRISSGSRGSSGLEPTDSCNATIAAISLVGVKSEDAMIQHDTPLRSVAHIRYTKSGFIMCVHENVYRVFYNVRLCRCLQ